MGNDASDATDLFQLIRYRTRPSRKYFPTKRANFVKWAEVRGLTCDILVRSAPGSGRLSSVCGLSHADYSFTEAVNSSEIGRDLIGRTHVFPIDEINGFKNASFVLEAGLCRLSVQSNLRLAEEQLFRQAKKW